MCRQMYTKEKAMTTKDLYDEFTKRLGKAGLRHKYFWNARSKGLDALYTWHECNKPSAWADGLFIWPADEIKAWGDFNHDWKRYLEALECPDRDPRDYELQEDTGYSNGCNMTEVKGPQSHRKPVDNCIQVRHYYAGYRVDDEPEITENRKIEPAGTYKDFQDFSKLLMKHNLFGVFTTGYVMRDTDKTLKEFLDETPREMWPVLGCAWNDNTRDFITLTKEWWELCAR